MFRTRRWAFYPSHSTRAGSIINLVRLNMPLVLYTIREMLTMRVSACLMGKDRRGWIYQGQLAFAAKELQRTLRIISSGSSDEVSDIRRVTDLTLWGLYNMTMYVTPVKLCVG